MSPQHTSDLVKDDQALCAAENANNTAESCACNKVSKLNDIPFHNVNSPEVDPVINRRPSGVHYVYWLDIIILAYNY
jgi:hypothetical protein